MREILTNHQEEIVAFMSHYKGLMLGEQYHKNQYFNCGYAYKNFTKALNAATRDAQQIVWYEKDGVLHLDAWVKEDNENAPHKNHYRFFLLTEAGYAYAKHWETNYSDDRSEPELHNDLLSSEEYCLKPYITKYLSREPGMDEHEK